MEQSAHFIEAAKYGCQILIGPLDGHDNSCVSWPEVRPEP